ncbi:hypothetical protein BGL68_05145 [Helicobacter pylori]|uniref:FeoA family protein n=1 Tax=Helicobacter pylori TaxID=210 RepID=UPI0009A37777|nr:hypothetical protein BGL68_05145 [Helicobacter pylori]
MTLNEAIKDKTYEIVEIANCDEALKKRFLSFGIHEGVQCILLHFDIIVDEVKKNIDSKRK